MSRRPAPAAPLGKRELALLRDIGRLRFMRADQVLRLHFAEGTPVGRQRRGQATLRRLTDDGYLHRLARSVGGSGSGSGRFVYQLGYRGQKTVWPDRRARTPEEAGQQFTHHALDTAELVVELVEAERRGELCELKIQTEPAVWRHYVAASGRMAVLKPDLGVHLETVVNGQRLVWFVEIDRATQGAKRIRAKAQQYLDYWRSGREQQRLGIFPRVLWVVPDDKRAVALVGALEPLPAPAPAMFAVATRPAAAVAAQASTNDKGETT